MTQGTIRIRGARQHNLKNLDLDIRTGEMTVVTGPSGSGKSSLVFDTLFAEGQRRYVETFSAYARQFLDRMDKPAVDKVEGVPPAIAIDQTNPVRSSRSTVGTMTELNDHLKLLYARAAQLFDKKTAQAVRHDTPESIYAELMRRTEAMEQAQFSAGPPQGKLAPLSGERGSETPQAREATSVGARLIMTFPVELPGNTSADEVTQWLSASGFTRVHAERDVVTPAGTRMSDAGPPQGAKAPSGGSAVREATSVGAIKLLDVVADRFRVQTAEKARVIEAIELALKRGGRLNVYVQSGQGGESAGPPQAEPAPSGGSALHEVKSVGAHSSEEMWRFSAGLHCPDSDLRYADPTPSLFSFNSAMGACDTCRGFGRVIGVDYGLVIPNDKLTLRSGPSRPCKRPPGPKTRTT